MSHWYTRQKYRFSDYTPDWIRICKHGAQEYILFTSASGAAKEAGLHQGIWKSLEYLTMSPLLMLAQINSPAHCTVGTITSSWRFNLKAYKTDRSGYLEVCFIWSTVFKKKKRNLNNAQYLTFERFHIKNWDFQPLGNLEDPASLAPLPSQKQQMPDPP